MAASSLKLGTPCKFVDEMRDLFKEKYGSAPDVIGCGPGRVNLIGEHTDYCGGFVFPIALDLKCVCALSLNDSGVFKFHSTNLKDSVEFKDSLPATPGKNHEWWNYVVGTMQCFYEHTKVPQAKGMNVLIGTTVPLGGGVSSSAALEVATLTAMQVVHKQESLSDVERAECICQKAEHVWAGVPCGLMDQAISIMGKKDMAMLFDCMKKEAKHAPLTDKYKIVVIDSGVRHKLVDGEYAKRKASCEEALKALKVKHPQLTCLREATMEQLDSVKGDMSEDTYTKASHVINECQRCLDFAKALDSGNSAEMGRVLDEGHWSLSKKYCVSVPQVDKIVTLAKPMDGVVGARITGGGFGGCVVVICDAAKAETVKTNLFKEYTEYYDKEGRNHSDRADAEFRDPMAYIVGAADGAHYYK